MPFVVRRILAATNSQLERLIGDAAVLRQLQPEAFTDAVFGMPTVTDILRELEKPGRDPRPVFKTVSFREGVEKLEDLQPGMVLEGVVTNVAACAPQPLPANFVHAEWITLHDNPDFRRFVDFLRAELDRVGPAQADLCRDFSRRAVGLELAFFEAAYRDRT